MANDREERPLKPQRGRKPPARLTPEERELWEHTAQSISPIKGKKQRVHPALEEERPASRPLPPEPPKGRATPARPAAPPPPAIKRPAPPLPTPGPAPISLERRKARKLSSGRIEIEGRIDLHGMRQSEAHTALLRFLNRAYAQGKRWVLVITGKGAPIRSAYDERLEREGEERGVLRRNVPRWLAEPEIAPIIIGFTTASIRHGGEGALYIHLRRRPGAPGSDD
ncbi:MAG TPA: Smr/MutS family protein [Hyphomicrobium sp.]|nr:Smr/MutS family protein [Hyphomicrobium sp.]